MIRTADTGAKRTVLLVDARRSNELRSAVPANVVEATHCAIVATHQQNTLAQDIDEAIVTFALQMLVAACAKPLAVKDSIAFTVEMPRIEIPRARQGCFQLLYVRTTHMQVAIQPRRCATCNTTSSLSAPATTAGPQPRIIGIVNHQRAALNEHQGFEWRSTAYPRVASVDRNSPNRAACF